VQAYIACFEQLTACQLATAAAAAAAVGLSSLLELIIYLRKAVMQFHVKLRPQIHEKYIDENQHPSASGVYALPYDEYCKGQITEKECEGTRSL